MRQKHLGGGPGVIISGLAWFIAACVTILVDFQTGMVVFFIAGALIYPLSSGVEKRMVSSPPEVDKSLRRLAILTLPLLFGGLYLGYILSVQDQALFYPVVAIAIGLRYLVFTRVYGLISYVVLGLVLVLTGAVAMVLTVPISLVPFLVGIIEVVFGSVILRRNFPVI